MNAILKLLATSTLNQFPEVCWDRFTHSADKLTVFGWIYRPDGCRDFMLVMIDGEDIRFVTSSAKYSAEFSARVGAKHTPCQRVDPVLNVRTF